MNVTKSIIYKLEIERDCGCKVAGDYEDAAYKKPRGTSIFTPCEKHKDAAGIELIEEMLREFLDKEARDAKAPEVMHPRTAALRTDATPEDAETANLPASRTLRTAGSSGTAGREQHRPASAPPRAATGGIHRPSTSKQAGKSSPFRISDPNANLSPQALARVAGVSASQDIDLQMMDLEPAAEDRRVTNVLNELNVFGGDDDEDGEDFED